MSLANKSYANGQNILAIDFAKKVWNKTPSIYASYIIACNYYMLDKIDSSAFYAGIAIYDKSIHQDVNLSKKQLNTLNTILKHFQDINTMSSNDLNAELYQNYPQKKRFM